jgi:KDO2-lipid IV(A) lauroyltransferase
MTWMAADQSPSKEAAVWLQFLNQDTPFFAGYEKIAKKTNQPVIFVDVQKVGRGFYEVEFILISKNPEETEDNFIVQKYAQLVENQIVRQPSYWLWSHKRWKHKRE